MPQLIWTDSVTVEWSPASDPFSETPTWVDITSKVWGITTSRGRSGSFSLYSTGKCTITVDNSAGTIDPTLWYRWRQIRITATATGPVSNVIFRGFVDEILHDQGAGPKLATANIQCIDLMGIVARDEFPAGGAYGKPVQRSGARITNILGSIVGFPAGWKNITTGYVDVSAIDDPIARTLNSLQHFQDVTEAEAGALYVTADGVLTFADRYELLNNLSSAPLTVFSDTYTGAEVAYQRGDVVLTPPGREYRNKVSITGASGDPQIESDVPTDFPPDTLSRTPPIASDGHAAMVAKFYLEVYSQTGVVWPENLTISVFTQNILDEITALDLRDYCQIEFTPAGNSQQTYKVFVESISHTISDVKWSVRIGFSSADRLEDAWGDKNDYLIIGDATYGLIGTGKIGPH